MNIEEEKIIKCEIKVEFITFPKDARFKHGEIKVDKGEYAIFKACVTKRLSGDIEIGKRFSLKGIVCSLSYGTTYTVEAKYCDTHPKYGDSYEIIFINRKIDISDKDKQMEFLSQILPVKTVDKLFETYDDVIGLLDNEDVESLCKINGIQTKTALRLIDRYNESKDYSEIYTEFAQLGLTSNMIKKLVDAFKSPEVVIDIIKNKPYELLKVDGIGFKTCDDIALRMGWDANDYRRIKAFLLDVLNTNGEEGKSYMSYNDLMYVLYDTLGFVNEETITKVANSMMENNEVKVFKNGEIIALTKYYNLEKNIYKELLRINKGITDDYQPQSHTNEFGDIIEDYIPSFNTKDYQEIINYLQTEQGYEFTSEQYNAIIDCIDNNIIVLTGLGGTGKSTTAKGMCKIFKYANISAMSLSGKASLRITEATGINASTIHRALGWTRTGFYFNERNKIPADIILIDETTMVNGTLFLSILKAMCTGSKLIILGDCNQLTSIGNCQVFVDILNSNVFKSVRLTQIHRQAKKSAIITYGIKIANQEQIFKCNYIGNQILGELQDLELNIYDKTDKLSDIVINKFLYQYNNGFNNLFELQIIVAQRLKGDLSCYNLNTKIQNILNPKVNDNEKEIIVYLEKKSKSKSLEELKQYHIRTNDKVINTKNNYNALDTCGNKVAVYNGNVGIVKSIDDNNYCTIDFVGVGEVVFNKSEAKNLELAYVSTVHKCITDDTWIYTSNGLKQLFEINNHPNVGQFKNLNATYGIYNGFNNNEIPINFYNAGLSDCLKIYTNRNYYLNCTKEHKIETINKDGKLNDKFASELTMDDYIIISKNMNIYGNNIDLPKSWNDFESKVSKNCKNYNHPNKLTLEFARFLGYMVADGVVCNHGLKYGKNHLNVVEDFNNIIKLVFGYSSNKSPKNVLPNGKLGGMWLSEINSTYIRDYCKQIDGIQPNNKYVPAIILSSPKKYQVEFLKGLFEDGSVCIKHNKFEHISFTSSSLHLIEQVRFMLLNMNIITTLLYRKDKKNYNLFIYGKNCDVFIKNIGFISSIKNLKCNKYYEYSHNDSNYIPYITNIIKDTLNKYKLNYKEIDTRLYYSIKENKITYNKLNVFLQYCKNNNIYDDDIKYLDWIYNYTYVDKIKNIEENKQNTYCIEMPITHHFVQNGFLAMNCQGSQYDCCIEALDNSSHNMNTCELLYTMISRAKKYSILIGVNSAICSAIRKKEVKTKQTFLYDMLVGNLKVD